MFHDDKHEIEHDHVLKIQQRSSLSRSGTMKLLKIVFADESKTRVNASILRGSDLIFLRQLLIGDEFKTLSEKHLPNIKMKCMFKYNGKLLAVFDKPHTTSISLTRELRFA